ncbi:MAG: CapA family protein [Treponemataceae bacterium]
MKLLFVGDTFIKQPERFSIEKTLHDFMLGHDVICCNFEAPIETDCKPILKRGSALFQSKYAPKKLSDYGFNLMSLANNHIMDYGKLGVENTLKEFASLNIPTVGAGFSDAEIYSPYYIKNKNETIAILSLCQAEFGVKKPNKGDAGYAWISNPNLRFIIPQIKKNSDTLIILCHAGLEDVNHPLPEWQQRYKYFVDLGADYVVGNHPHVIQGFEEYKNKFICYSLGNFIFDSWSDDNYEYYRSIILSIDTSGNKINYNIKPVKFNEGYIEFDKSKKTATDIEERCKLICDTKLLETWADKTAETLWTQYYKSYYMNLNNSAPVNKASYLTLIKAIIKKLLNWKSSHHNFDETMLLHNIQIETHRWLVERYLFNKNIEENEL